MREALKKRKIPTILGILVLIIGVAAGVFLVQSRQIFRLGASPETNPKDVRITNVSDSSFSVSWTTDKETQGFISWGENRSSLDKTAASTTSVSSNIHSVSLHGLSSATPYFFKINSDGKEFDNNGTLWDIKTGPSLTVLPKSVLISGTVLTPDGTPAQNVLVYASVGGGNMLSTTSDNDGGWVIPISSARTQDLSKYIVINETSTLVEIVVQAGPLGVASAQIYPSAAKPAPEIILGQVHDFKNLPPSEESGLPEALIGMPQDATKSSGFNVPDEMDLSSIDSVTLESVDEAEVVTTTEPEFFGEGPPGTEITITLESDPVTDQVEVDSDGEWSWSPPEDLAEGIHNITITWLDIDGIVQTITRSFVVQAQEGPAFVATPSATPTSIPAPTAIPTATATITGTPLPSPTPTLVPTIIPTSTPTPIPTKVATSSALPVAGVATPTILLLIMGLGSIILGTLLFISSDKERKEL